MMRSHFASHVSPRLSRSQDSRPPFGLPVLCLLQLHGLTLPASSTFSKQLRQNFLYLFEIALWLRGVIQPIWDRLLTHITFQFFPDQLRSTCPLADCTSFNVALGSGGLAIACSIATLVLHSIFTCCASNKGVGIASIVLSTLTCLSCAGALIAWRAYESTLYGQIAEYITGNKPKPGYSFGMMAASTAVHLLSAILSLLASRNLRPVQSMLIMPEINSGGSTAVVTSSSMQQMGIQQPGYMPQQGYAPQGGNHAPQQQGGYAPQQQQDGGYAPQQNYAPQQQQGGYAPKQQQGGGYAPQQQLGGSYAPQQQQGGGYAPQQQQGGGYAPQQQQGGGYPPQQQQGGGYAPQQQQGGGYEPQQSYALLQQGSYELQPIPQQGGQGLPPRGNPFEQDLTVHQDDGFQPHQHPFQPENDNQNTSKDWYGGSDA